MTFRKAAAKETRSLLAFVVFEGLLFVTSPARSRDPSQAICLRHQRAPKIVVTHADDAMKQVLHQ